MDQISDKPKPVRQSRWQRLITPWRWSRRRRVGLLILALLLFPVVYVISAVPVIYVLYRIGVRDDPTVQATVRVVYAPLAWLEQKSPRFRDALGWQMAVMMTTFGNPDE